MTARMRSADWKSFALWVIGITVAGLGMAWVLRSESQRQLEAATTESGLRWAEFAARCTQGIQRGFCADTKRWLRAWRGHPRRRRD